MWTAQERAALLAGKDWRQGRKGQGEEREGDGDSGGVAGKELKLTNPDWEEQMRRLHERME